MALDARGSVLGVDIGWSLQRRSSAACRLDWDETRIGWQLHRFTAVPDDRRAALQAAMGSHHLLVAAFDGPLRGDLRPIETYRLAERRLSERWLRDAVGKIGQSNSGSGRLLSAATNACAAIVLEHGLVGPARHAEAIRRLAVVEAFPNSFLGLMLADPAPHKGGRGQRSDRFFKALVADGTLVRLVENLLPGRRFDLPLERITNHDDRAALVCALSALCVAAGRYQAVGDREGWIILPPPDFVAPWAQPMIAAWNQERVP